MKKFIIGATLIGGFYAYVQIEANRVLKEYNQIRKIKKMAKNGQVIEVEYEFV